MRTLAHHSRSKLALYPVNSTRKLMKIDLSSKNSLGSLFWCKFLRDETIPVKSFVCMANASDWTNQKIHFVQLLNSLLAFINFAFGHLTRVTVNSDALECFRCHFQWTLYPPQTSCHGAYQICRSDTSHSVDRLSSGIMYAGLMEMWPHVVADWDAAPSRRYSLRAENKWIPLPSDSRTERLTIGF